MKSIRRWFWNLSQEWEQVRCFGVKADRGELIYEAWSVRLEMAAKYAILGSTHRAWLQ